MKLNFTLFVLLVLVAVSASAQDGNFRQYQVSPKNAIEQSTPAKQTLVFRCGAMSNPRYSDPLLVIDGVLHELNAIQKLNPNDIESITILKEPTSSVIFGCRAAAGVIVVTTKAVSQQTVIVKDFLTGQKLPGATICFKSNNHSTTVGTDENGILKIDKLKGGVDYSITVSSAGYKTSTVAVTKREQEVLLERDVKENAKVVVVGYASVRRRCPGCCCGVIWRWDNSMLGLPVAPAVKPVYPNPVQRNNSFKIDLNNEAQGSLSLTILSLNGTIVLAQSLKTDKGSNHFEIKADPRWSAGIYVVQLRNGKGSVIKQEKLIVQ